MARRTPDLPPLQLLSPLHKATRQVAVFLQPRMADLGLAGPEAHLVAYLRSYAPCAIGELSRVFGYKPSTLTSMLDRLEDKGLVQRALDPDDRRSFQVNLTPSGRTLAGKVRRILEQIEETIAARVTARERQGFAAVLRAVAEATDVDVSAQPERPRR